MGKALRNITEILVEGMSGEQYSAKTYEGIVTEMRASAWGGDESNGIKGYMKQVAKRVGDWCGAVVRVDRTDHFLEDLQSQGLIRLVIKDED